MTFVAPEIGISFISSRKRHERAQHRVGGLRGQVAACTRIMNAEGLIDYSGHVSARLPDGSGLIIRPSTTPCGAVTIRPSGMRFRWRPFWSSAGTSIGFISRL